MNSLKNFIKWMAFAFLTLMFSGLLSGCFNRGENGGGDLQAYQGTNFTINVNPAWTILQPSDFQENIPRETIVAFVDVESTNGFFNNVNVSKETLQSPVSSIDYGRANITLASQNLTDYKKSQEAEIDLNGTAALVHIFEARLNPSEKLTRFYQLYATQGSTGYIVTGGVLPDTPEEQRDAVGAMVTSFRFTG